MFSLRSILFAAAAFATVASAIPTPAPPDGLQVGDTIDTIDKETDTMELLISKFASSAINTRGDSYTPADSFKKCSDGIAVIVVEISRYLFFYLYNNQTKLYIKNQSLLFTVRAVPRKLTTMLLSACLRISLPFLGLFS
jgi:hypothetical protein